MNQFVENDKKIDESSNARLRAIDAFLTYQQFVKKRRKNANCIKCPFDKNLIELEFYWFFKYILLHIIASILF